MPVRWITPWSGVMVPVDDDVEFARLYAESPEHSDMENVAIIGICKRAMKDEELRRRLRDVGVTYWREGAVDWDSPGERVNVGVIVR